jgi:transcriptional regulator with XRE-family HTH domain
MDQDIFFKLVGKKIRELRIEKGYPAYDSFAFSKELPRHNVLRAEQGKSITTTTLIKIINALEVSPEEFFKGIK